jgi:hypothetical protein
MFQTRCTLIYDPVDARATRKGLQSWWLMAKASRSIADYYIHRVRKELGVHGNLPLWSAHVTVTRGEAPKFSRFWKKYAGKEVVIRYSENIQVTDKYAWATVESEDLEDIRVELGLTPRPRCPYHLTLMNFKNTTPPKKKVAPFKVFPWETYLSEGYL